MKSILAEKQGLGFSDKVNVESQLMENLYAADIHEARITPLY